MDAFVIRTKRRVEVVDSPGRSTPLAKRRFAQPRPRHDGLPGTVVPEDTPDREATNVWGTGTPAGIVWSHIVDRLVEDASYPHVVRTIRALVSLAMTSRLVRDVVQIKRIRVDLLTALCREGHDAPQTPITVACSVAPLSSVGIKPRVTFSLRDGSRCGVSLYVAHKYDVGVKYWYRVRTGLLCACPLHTDRDAIEPQDETATSPVANRSISSPKPPEPCRCRTMDQQGRPTWHCCERLVSMPKSHRLCELTLWRDPPARLGGSADTNEDADGDDDHRDGVDSGSPPRQKQQDAGDDDARDVDRDDSDVDDSDDESGWGKWRPCDNRAWSMWVYCDYRGHLHLEEVSVRLDQV